MTPLPPDSEHLAALRAAVERQEAARAAASADTNGGSRPSGWPGPPAPDAFHGLAGDVVRALDPYTEADPFGVLLTYLARFGNAAGRNAFMIASGGTHHHARLFVSLTGPTSGGRKGTADATARLPIDAADPEWAQKRILYGAVSGEGVIYHVRDERTEKVPIYESEKHPKGEIVGWRDEPKDPGVEDKRLLYVMEEFAAPLAVTKREGNTLSAVMRQSWDGRPLDTGAKNERNIATGAHVSFIAHITVEELKQLVKGEIANGFANRFLWACVRQSKYLPEPQPIPDELIADLAGHTRNALEFARRIGRVERTAETKALWATAYRELGRDRGGMFGKACDRAQAQVLRLQLLFALLGCSPVIEPEHLRAALAVWDYCERSAAHIFSGALTKQEQLAERIAGMLGKAGREGVTRTAIRDALGTHVAANEIDDALTSLQSHGRAWAAREDTGGRPAERWFDRSGGVSLHSSLSFPRSEEEGQR